MVMPPVPPPPRPRFGSSPHWDALGELRGEFEALKMQVARVESAVVTHAAGRSHQTLQLLIGGVVSVVVAVTGSRVVAPKPEPTTTVVQRSAYDRAIEACQKLADDVQRGQCIVKVSANAAGLPKE